MTGGMEVNGNIHVRGGISICRNIRLRSGIFYKPSYIFAGMAAPQTRFPIRNICTGALVGRNTSLNTGYAIIYNRAINHDTLVTTKTIIAESIGSCTLVTKIPTHRVN